MLLENNTIKVIELMKYVDDLETLDKVRLAIHILENKSFTTEYDINNIITLLKNVLNQLDPNYSKVITNFAKYKNLLLLSSKYMELSYLDKKFNNCIERILNI